MTANPDELRRLLKGFDFRKLFIERLGWDRHQARPLVVPLDGTDYTLDAVAQKRGMVVYACAPGPDGGIPDATTRRRLDKEVTKAAYEHILVFADAARTAQVWQWVRRQRGKPAAFRQHTFHKDQPGDSLIQKLQAIRFTLDEEERLTQPEVPGRVRQAFDVDRVTKRFYDLFKREHAAFLAFIEGITLQGDREWYASVMLNRLMFVYFIQKQGFLDGDDQYLRNRLKRVQKERGADKFHSFYRYFLLRLFHEGLGLPVAARKPELDKLLGKVPYLNGGIFELHELERAYKDNIQIPDAAFERIFTFFDAYQWHLDDRPLARDNEINPDVLGYIFEKYINQKQMGAYYTKEDITGNIARNTILPFLLAAAATACPDAFRPDGPVWRLLRDDPDKYIYDAVRYGVDLPLPDAIKPGVKDVSRRDGWNRPAADGFALPTETWREYVERRTRCHELRRKLRAGEVHEVNDLITYNLDIRQFAEDVVDTCDDPDLLRAVWRAVCKVSVLDPTCGSGAFLFAALNILEPLYEACLDRMQAFLDELDASVAQHRPEKLADFRKVLDQVKRHPSRQYFIYKSIIVHNLYGVDIMKEAVEIRKLRLFLKLVSQVRRVDQLEPLPDIDFNIRAGNTLVGFASLAAVREMAKGRLVLDPETVEQILADAQKADECFKFFRQMQTEFGTDAVDFQDAKAGLRARLAKLRDQLDRHLASEYDVDPDNPVQFGAWQESHKPFHWFTEFYGIMARGGFDVIIGNPPYLEKGKLDGMYSVRGYRTGSCRDIYAWFIERALQIPSGDGKIGMIVPVSLASSGSFGVLRDLASSSFGTLWLSHFANRPGQLFSGAENRLTIFIGSVSEGKGQAFSTRYHRWDARNGERDALFAFLRYIPLEEVARQFHGLYAKAGTVEATSILRKLESGSTVGAHIRKRASHPVYWVRVPGYFCQFFLRPPMARPENGGSARVRGEVKEICFGESTMQRVVHSLLNSSTYFQFYCAYTDGRHINPSDVSDFPFDYDALAPAVIKALVEASGKLEGKMSENTSEWRKSGLLIESVRSPTKPVLDEIDRALARHYGFTDEELDFILNYDIKYRMGQDAAGDEDE